jgi:Arc/MetJ-type ribon-helix-helix transcriptional regulator
MIMKRPAKPIQKKKDRVPTQGEPFSAVQLPAKLTAAIDKWAEGKGITSRSEAIRRLLELGLASSTPLRQRNLETASKALGLAAQVLDKLIDPSTPH